MDNLQNNSIYKEVLARANIYDVINSYGIEIHRDKCLCPFHNDKNPSMSIHPEKQIFKCFSCGESGNAISFVYKYETQVNMNKNFTKRDALLKVMEICKIEDIELTQEKAIELSPQDKKKREIIEVNNFAHRVFKYNLRTEEGQEALKYLYSRNISEDLIEKMGIGYASGNDIFSKQDDVIKYSDAGLVYINEDYKKDIFKNRIIFPIFNDKGDLVGFSGRTLSKEKSNAKYLNTKETEAFDKSQILYNYNRALAYNHNLRNELELPQIYLVEGYMDVIGCEKLGIHNSVASMGTALTSQQIELLKNANCKVNLMKDTDLPGRDAMLQDITMLENANIEYSVIDLASFFDEKDIGDIAENFVHYQENNPKELIDSLKVSGFVFKIREYIRRNSLDKLNTEQLKEMISYFKVDKMSDQKIEEFISEVKNVTFLSEKQIENALYPNGKFKQFKDSFLENHIMELLEKEIQSRENLILFQYFKNHKSSIFSTIMKIIDKNSEKLINLESGTIYIGTALNAYLRLDKNYSEYEKLNQFKFPNIFNQIYVSRESKLNSAVLNKHMQNNLIMYLEEQLKDKMDTTLKDIKELYIINSVDDLFQILPTKMIDPFTFSRIQNAIFNNDVSVFDFNHCFDEEELNRGILNMFDQSYKDENGRLKKIILLPNISNQIKYSIKSVKNQNEQKQTLEEVNNDYVKQDEYQLDNYSKFNDYQSQLDNIPESFKQRDKKTGQIEIGCTIDEVLFNNNNHTDDYMFVRVPRSGMKYYIHAKREDIKTFRDGKTLYLKLDLNQKFELYDRKNRKLNKVIGTVELLDFFDKKENNKNYNPKSSRQYFVVFSKLIVKETEEGFYFKSPKDSSKIFYASKETLKWKDDQKKSLQVFIEQNSISQYVMSESGTNNLHFEKSVNKVDLEKHFKIFNMKINNEKKSNKVFLSFENDNVDICIIDNQEIAIINFEYQGKSMQLKIPKKYIFKQTSQESIFKLGSEWKYTLTSDEFSKPIKAEEINQMLLTSKEQTHNYEMVKGV